MKESSNKQTVVKFVPKKSDLQLHYEINRKVVKIYMMRACMVSQY
jgi:hypothetical protein